MMTFEERQAALDVFFEKYRELIYAADENSLLGMVRMLEDTITDLEKVKEWDCVNLVRARKNVSYVECLLAQMWSDENQDIELYAADPADGENWTVSSKQEEEKKTEGMCSDCANCKVPDGMVLYPKWAGYCQVRNKWVARVSGCTDRFESKNKEES